MLTSQAREIFEGAEQVIVDEIHAVAQTKRGAHLALTLERLAEQAGSDLQRIGLSATQNPLEEVGRFLVGPKRTCTIVDTGTRKPLDLKIHVPVDIDGRARASPTSTSTRSPGGTRRASRSGPRSIPSCSRRCARTARRSSSSTTAVHRSGWRCGSTSSPRSRSRGGITARSRARSGSVVEEQLKAGELPCLVATSSLELGIDMGAVDLVLQVESPEVGDRRAAAHRPLRTRRGRHRQGPHLPQVPRRPARVRRRREAHARGADRAHRRPAQPARRAGAADRRHRGVRRDHGRRRAARARHAHAFVRRALHAQLENVLDMLDGRYPSEEFGELRPRIVWDRVGGTIRARKGARALAITNAGTIPDRGLFSVNLPDGRRVGELDEEMVYEARPGQVFLLGASSWRIEEITRDRVVVTPAPGVPGAVPFWKGDGVGRPRELGEAIGAFARWAVDQEPPRSPTATTSTRSPRRTCSPSCASSRPPRASSRATVRSSSSASATRSATGACRPLPLRRPRARRLGPCAERADPRGVRGGVRRDLVRRRDHRAPSRRR